MKKTNWRNIVETFFEPLEKIGEQEKECASFHLDEYIEIDLSNEGYHYDRLYDKYDVTSTADERKTYGDSRFRGRAEAIRGVILDIIEDTMNDEGISFIAFIEKGILFIQDNSFDPYGTQCFAKVVENDIVDLYVTIGTINVYNYLIKYPTVKLVTCSMPSKNHAGTVMSDCGYVGFNRRQDVLAPVWTQEDYENISQLLGIDIQSEYYDNSVSSSRSAIQKEMYDFFAYKIEWENANYPVDINGKLFVRKDKYEDPSDNKRDERFEGFKPKELEKDVVIPQGYNILNRVMHKDISRMKYIKYWKIPERLILDKGLRTIEIEACRGLSNLKEAYMPGVWRIHGSAFCRLRYLKNVYFSSVKYIDLKAFEGCSALEEIKLPESLISIGREAFSHCVSLKKIEIPEKVIFEEYTSFPVSGVFQGCTSLEEVIIKGNVRIIGSEMFKDCSSLKKIVLPDTVTEIAGEAFEGCTSLESIVLPTGLRKIGFRAFADCISLKNINIPEHTSVDPRAFEGCNIGI